MGVTCNHDLYMLAYDRIGELIQFTSLFFGGRAASSRNSTCDLDERSMLLVSRIKGGKFQILYNTNSKAQLSRIRCNRSRDSWGIQNCSQVPRLIDAFDWDKIEFVIGNNHPVPQNGIIDWANVSRAEIMTAHLFPQHFVCRKGVGPRAPC